MRRRHDEERSVYDKREQQAVRASISDVGSDYTDGGAGSDGPDCSPGSGDIGGGAGSDDADGTGPDGAEPDGGADSGESKKAAGKKKKKRLKILYSVIEAVLVLVFIFSGAKIAKTVVDSVRGSSADSDVDSIADGGDVDYDVGDEVIRDDPSFDISDEDVIIDSEDPYTNITEFMTDKNIPALKAQNPDTVGWIYVGGPASVRGLPISGVLLQAEDNDYYLSHTFSGAQNMHGSIFMDYRNDPTSILNNKNIVVYGHASSYSRFGGLKYLNDRPAWNSNKAYQFVKIQTDTETSIWRIFSWYEADAFENTRQTYFSSDEEFIEYCTSLQARSEIKTLSSFEFNADDIIMTMSTCKGADVNNRVLVHALLVSYAKLS